MLIEQLIHECTKNNTEAKEQLYRLLSPKLFAVCLKYSKSYEEAQDNLQDGFLLLFDKIHQFKHKGSFEGWLKRVTVNTVLQKYRKEAALSIVSDTIEEEVEVESGYLDISLPILLKHIQDLPNKYRITFNMYVLDGYSHKDIADMLDINIGTSKSNLARARQILKQTIEEYKVAHSLQSL